MSGGRPPTGEIFGADLLPLLSRCDGDEDSTEAEAHPCGVVRPLGTLKSMNVSYDFENGDSMHPNDRPNLLPCAVLSLLLAVAAVPVRALPSIVAVPKGLVAQGITPGGRAIWWSVAHEHPDAFETIVHRLEEQIDDDQDGSVVFDPKGPVAFASLWVVVDVATGTYATYAPEDFGVSEIPLPAEAAVQSSGRSPADEFREVARPLVEVLLIRAGQGAWILRAGDGGPTDLDSVEGELSFAIDSMAAVGASPAAPDRYVAGDRLLSIDVEQLELSSLLVGSPPPAGTAGARAEVRR